MALLVGLLGSSVLCVSGCGQLSASPAAGEGGSTVLAVQPKSGALGDNYVTLTPADVQNGSLVVNLVLSNPSGADQAVVCKSTTLVVGSASPVKPATCVWERTSAQGAEGSLSFAIPTSFRTFRVQVHGGSGSFSASWTTQSFFAGAS